MTHAAIVVVDQHCMFHSNNTFDRVTGRKLQLLFTATDALKYEDYDAMLLHMFEMK